MKFYIACIQKINEVVDNLILSSNEKFVACPSLRVFESEDFNFLSGENLTQKDFLKSEDISMQLNSLSDSAEFWDIDPNRNLFEKFKQCITDIKIKPKEDVENQYQKFIDILYNADESETKILEKYNEKLSEYESLIENYEDIVNEFSDDNTPEEKTAILQRLDVAEKRLALHIASWKLNGIKDTVENALEKLNKLTIYDQFLKHLRSIKSKVENAEVTGLQSLNDYSKLQIIPFDFYEDEHAWSSLEVNNNELDSLFKKAKQNLKGFNESILDFDYKEDFIEKITLRYCVFSIKRAWLFPSIFDNEFIRKIKKTKLFYAKRIILIKDLRVILKEDLTEQEKTEINKNSVIKFGPIFMKNQFFKNKISKEAFIKPITNKRLYKDISRAKLDKKIAKKVPHLMTMHRVDKPKVMFARLAKPTNAPKARNLRTSRLRHTVIKPVEAKPTPIKIGKINTKAMMFHKINWGNKSKSSNLHFSILDILSKEGVYKAEISIKNNSSNFFKSIESDETGAIKDTLPKGNYQINIRKNGYKEVTFTQIVQENKNITIKKELEPQEVIYDSYFLIGVIGETINL